MAELEVAMKNNRKPTLYALAMNNVRAVQQMLCGYLTRQNPLDLITTAKADGNDQHGLHT